MDLERKMNACDSSGTVQTNCRSERCLDQYYFSTKKILQFKLRSGVLSKNYSELQEKMSRFHEQTRVILKVVYKTKTQNILAEDRSSNLVLLSSRQKIYVVLKGPSELLSLLQNCVGSLCQTVFSSGKVYHFPPKEWPFQLSSKNDEYIKSPPISLHKALRVSKNNLYSMISLVIGVKDETLLIFDSNNKNISFRDRFDWHLPEHYHKTAKPVVPLRAVPTSLPLTTIPPKTLPTIYPADPMRNSSNLTTLLPAQNLPPEATSSNSFVTKSLELTFQDPVNKRQKKECVDKELEMLDEELRGIKIQKEVQLSLIKEMQSKYSLIISKERMIIQQKVDLFKEKARLEFTASLPSPQSDITVPQDSIPSEVEILSEPTLEGKSSTTKKRKRLEREKEIPSEEDSERDENDKIDEALLTIQSELDRAHNRRE